MIHVGKGRGAFHKNRKTQGSGGPSGPVVLLLHTHTDSLGVGVQFPEDYTTTYGTVKQYNSGLTATIMPLRQAIAFDANNYISPFQQAIRTLADAGNTVVFSGGGYNGQSVAAGTHDLGPTPSGTTVSNLAQLAAAKAAILAATPTANIKIVVHIWVGSNDIIAAYDPALTMAALQGVMANYRSAQPSCLFVVHSPLPEHFNNPGYIPNSQKLTAGLKAAALNGTYGNSFYVTCPTGYTTDNLHTSPAAKTRDYGASYIAPMTRIAIGQIAATAPDFSGIPDPIQIIESTTTAVGLPCANDDVYYSAPTTGGGTAVISGDVAALLQTLLPNGGTWPAYDAGTPGNNFKSLVVPYKTGRGVVGSLSRTVQIIQAAALPSIIYSGGAASISQAIVSGKRYLMGTWSGAGSAIGGVGQTEKVSTSGAAGNPKIRIFEYLSATTGNVTFDAGAGAVMFIADIGTSLAYNGTSQSIDVDNHSGAFSLGSITGTAFAMFVATGGQPSVNLTLLLQAAGDPNFYSFAAAGSPNIAGSWSGFSGAAAIGLS